MSETANRPVGALSRQQYLASQVVLSILAVGVGVTEFVGVTVGVTDTVSEGVTVGVVDTVSDGVTVGVVDTVSDGVTVGVVELPIRFLMALLLVLLIPFLKV